MSCIIWVLGALLIVATLDTVPDPPALKPGPASACSATPTCDCFGNIATLGNDCHSAISLLPAGLVAAVIDEPSGPAEMVVTVQAADPSPPLQLAI